MAHGNPLAINHSHQPSAISHDGLLTLLVSRVLPTEAAELRELQPLGRLLLVLRRAVVAPPAHGARERHDVSHGFAFRSLFDDIGHRAGADRPAALADREARALLERDGRHQLAADRRVVAGHHHLDALRQVQRAGDVGGADVELRTIAVEERRVAAALLLREDVYLALELRVRLDRAGLREHLAALHVVFFHAAQEDADVVAGDALVEQLAEHLDAGDDLLLGRLEADDLDFLADLHLAALDAAGDDGAAPRDREDVLDRHQERLVDLALRDRHVAVERFHQLDDARDTLRVALQRLERRQTHHRDVVAGELVVLEQLAHLELDEIEQLGIVDRVHLVQRDDEVLHVHLAGEQDVLARLRHRAVHGADDENGAVHLRGAGDHVLDVVGVTRAVDVRIVPLGARVLDVRGRDGENLRVIAPSLRLGRLRDLVVRDELRPSFVGRDLRERGSERRLAVVDVADGADVDVRFAAIEFLFSHSLDPRALLNRALEPMTRIELVTSSLPRTRSAN